MPDELTWSPFNEDVTTTVELIRKLYEDLQEPTGGPLHWILDDLNVEDDQLVDRPGEDLYAYLFDGRYERWAWADKDVSQERKQAIKETCELILTAFRQMPEAQRRLAIRIGVPR